MCATDERRPAVITESDLLIAARLLIYFPAAWLLPSSTHILTRLPLRAETASAALKGAEEA